MTKRPSQGPGITTVTKMGQKWPCPTYNLRDGNEHSVEQHFDHLKQFIHAVATCKPGRKRVAIQAGGSVGVYAKYLASEFSRVFTFEPHPDLFPCLVRNVPERNVVKQQAVLGSLGGSVLMDYENFGAHSVSVTDSFGRFPKVRIDDMKLPDVDLIALDIEGYEYFALAGAVETIKRCKPVIIVEECGHGQKYLVPEAGIDKLLLGLGYSKGRKYGYDRLYLPEGNSICKSL